MEFKELAQEIEGKLKENDVKYVIVATKPNGEEKSDYLQAADCGSEDLFNMFVRLFTVQPQMVEIVGNAIMYTIINNEENTKEENTNE